MSIVINYYGIEFIHKKTDFSDGIKYVIFIVTINVLQCQITIMIEIIYLVELFFGVKVIAIGS